MKKQNDDDLELIDVTASIDVDEIKINDNGNWLDKKKMKRISLKDIHPATNN